MNSLSNISLLLDNFKNIIKKNFKKKNLIIFYYLLGCTSNFLICEIIKNLNFFNNVHKSHKYNNCINILKKDIIMKDTIKICEILNNQENFQKFIYNLFYTWLIIYIIMREVINKKIFCFKYWIISHLSLIIYTVIGEIKLFQFSITNTSLYNDSRKKILYTVFLILLIPMLINIYLKKVKLGLIFKFILIYTILYLLLLTVTNNITIHLHHVLVSGFCSLFFTDFKSKINYYIHSILIGIVIQGINFYNTTELMMFYISDIKQPSLKYLCVLYSIFLSIWILFLYFKNKYLNKRNNINNNNLYIQLIPSERDIKIHINN
jgi:hypothetical protein